MLDVNGRLPVDTDDWHDPCCTESTAADGDWLRVAGWVRVLSWISVAWMSVEGVFGLVLGISAGSVALAGWALSSFVEGLASIIVIWRFTGDRTLSATSERTAQHAVAVSFWLLAP